MIILKEAFNKKFLRAPTPKDLKGILDLEGILAYEATTPNLNMRALAPTGGGYITSSESSDGTVSSIVLVGNGHKTLLMFNASLIRSVLKQHKLIRFDLADESVIEFYLR